MAFRQTAFDPMDTQGMKANDPKIDFTAMDRQLARELANMNIDDQKKRKEIEKICSESDELKELQGKIRAAYLNKERSAQIAENQFREQVKLVSYKIFKSIFYSHILFNLINIGKRLSYGDGDAPTEGASR